MLPANLAALVKDVASTDPHIRDELAYPQLAVLIKSGQVNDEQLTELGQAMIDRLHHPQIQARTFAPLILARVAAKDVWHQDWTSVFLDWWVGELDLRGYDEHLGWLHAVAHGADCAGQLGMRQLADPSVLLDAVAARMVTPTEYVWRDQEEDRIAACICAVLWPAAPLNTRWMNPIKALFATGEPEPVPPNASNTMRTLRSLYVALASSGSTVWRHATAACRARPSVPGCCLGSAAGCHPVAVVDADRSTWPDDDPPVTRTFAGRAG